MILPHDSNCVKAASHDVDGAVGVPDTKWFVAIVNSRHEKMVEKKLSEIGVEAYVATQKEMRVWANGRRKIIDRVVIPSMVFVKCTEQQRRQIVNLPYINRFLVNRSADSGGLNKPVAVIADAEISTLKFMLGHAESPVEIVRQHYHSGDRVRVIRGNLHGLEGEVLTDGHGDTTLYVALDILGYARLAISSTDLMPLI